MAVLALPLPILSASLVNRNDLQTSLADFLAAGMMPQGPDIS